MDLIINIIDLTIINIYFKTFLNKYGKLQNIISHIAILILSIGMLFINKQNIYLLNLVYFISVIIVISLFYKGSLKSKIFISLVYMAGGFIAETISIYVLILLNNLFITDQKYNIFYLIAISLSEGIRIIIAFFIIKVNKDMILMFNRIYYWISALLIAIITSCIIMMHYIAESNSTISFILNTIMLIIIFTISFCSLFIIKNITQNMHKDNDNRLLLQEMKYKEEYYTLLKLQQDNIEKAKHNYKNQLIGIIGLMEKDREECKKELDLLLLEFNNMDNELHTSNYILNFICRNKFKIARENSININSNLSLPNFLNINATELSVLYGNLLDNAIEACLSLPCEKRTINFYSSYNSGKLLIQINNYFINTEKIYLQDNQKHGLGLISVREIVDKYNGIMDITKENECFEVKIIMYS